MEFEKYKKELVEYLQESVRLFSNEGKKERELWIVQKFLGVLDVHYTAREFYQPPDDPPDVIFHKGRFEISELYDEGRRRHDEYRDYLRKAQAAQNWEDIRAVETWDRMEMSLQEVVAAAEEGLRGKKGNYSPDTKMGLDALIYVNLRRLTIDDEDFLLDALSPQSSSLKLWRSVSLVFNRSVVCVIAASISAPEFIRTAAGRIVRE